MQVRNGEYYGSGRITDGLKKFFHFVKRGYENNKELFAPIRDALLSATTSTITDAVNKGATALTNKVAEKTNNQHVNRIAEAVSDVSKSIGDQVNKKIEASVLA